jgi:hypothetical protein
MDLIKYPHLERFGTDEVDGINIGECHIFPKIDGTNASFWWDLDTGQLACGSRNRTLALGDDNAGFMAWAVQQPHICELARLYHAYRFYGEWLVPHSLKTYRDDAWRQLYIFDVLDATTGEFLHYDVYSKLLAAHGVNFIPAMAQARNPTYEQLVGCTERNTFLLQENKGVGEGIVIKQYGWKNLFARTTWAKLITNTFKDEHIKEMGGAVLTSKLVEEEIAEEFLTKHDVDKIIAKIRIEKGQFGARDIPQLLGTAFHELVTENLWEAVKKHRNPKIDFKTLNHCAIARVKHLLPELFGMKGQP